MTRLLSTAGPQLLYNYYQTGTLSHTNTNHTGEAYVSGTNPSTGVYESGYLQTFNLITHKNALDLQENVSNVFKSLTIVHLLGELGGFFSNLKYNNLNEEQDFFDFVTSLVLHHFENIPYNAVCFSELRTSIQASPPVSVPYGIGLFPTISLLNHSCCPNAIHVRNSKFCKSSIVSLRPLSPGEEICISYGPTFYHKDRIERRKELKEKYNFICQCLACSGNWPKSRTTDMELSNMSCSNNCTVQRKCGRCLEQIIIINSQIEKYESQLHEAHDLLKLVDENGNAMKVIQLLKPCLDFFATNFTPSYDLTQVAQDLFKKALLAFVSTLES